MPSADASGAREKSSSRGSIRNPLTFAKAFAEAMHKDSDKTVKRSQGRTSAIHMKAAAPRQSIDDTKPPTPPAKRIRTPDSTTITTRRRMSAGIQPQRQPSDDTSTTQATSPEGAGLGRRSSLRPRPATSSGLPKYRPKSIVLADGTSKRTSSPARRAARKRVSSSADEEDTSLSKNDAEMAEKSTRPISPLPHRTALKSSNAINSSGKSTPSRSRAADVTPKNSGKDSKDTSTPSRLAMKAASTPRPPSSSSSSSSLPPRTPSNIAKTAIPRSDKPKHTPSRSRHESPLSRHDVFIATSTPKSSPTRNPGNMSNISEGVSEDIDAEDVKNLLAPTARLCEPTPAMPRIMRSRRDAPPAGRQMPLPPDPETPPAMRTRSSLPGKGKDKETRGSILSWEQLANQSKSLDEDDIASMLADMPAPFQSGTLSPPRNSMLLGVPDSPCLSTMSSPSNFGSISQVLLPAVTPSPAPHHQRYDHSGEAKNVDGAIVTLLRLQLASAETMAKERLQQLQNMEQENHNLKQAHARDVKQLSATIGELESHTKGSMAAHERTAEEHSMQVASMEQQLRHVEESKGQAIKLAVTEAHKVAKSETRAALKAQNLKLQHACVAQVAATKWGSVKSLLADELDRAHSDRDILALLHSQLAIAETQLASVS